MTTCYLWLLHVTLLIHNFLRCFPLIIEIIINYWIYWISLKINQNVVAAIVKAWFLKTNSLLRNELPFVTSLLFSCQANFRNKISRNIASIHIYISCYTDIFKCCWISLIWTYLMFRLRPPVGPGLCPGRGDNAPPPEALWLKHLINKFPKKRKIEILFFMLYFLLKNYLSDVN